MRLDWAITVRVEPGVVTDSRLKWANTTTDGVGVDASAVGIRPGTASTVRLRSGTRTRPT